MKELNTYIVEKFKISNDINSDKVDHSLQENSPILRVAYVTKSSVRKVPYLDIDEESFVKIDNERFWFKNDAGERFRYTQEANPKLNCNGIYETSASTESWEKKVIYLNTKDSLEFLTSICNDFDKKKMNLDLYFDEKDNINFDKVYLGNPAGIKYHILKFKRVNEKH